MIRRVLLPLLVATILGGCTLAPAYVRPALPVSQAWPLGGRTADPATPSAADLAWREVFLDPRLQAVIELSLRQNRDLHVAIANIERARAQYRVQRAQLLPAIDAEGAQNRIHTPAALSGTGRALTIETYSASVGVAAYELDLFGRLRSLNAAALQSYFATAEIRRAAQISIIAETAADYLTLAADQDLLAVTRDTLASREDDLVLARKRFEAGATSELDLNQQQTLTEQARSDLAQALVQVAQDRNALTLVVGAEIPEALLPTGGVARIGLRADLEPGLPSEVLIRRPDVLAAEHNLEAQNANIGAARAAFFPRITLTGDTGSASPELSGLFEGGAGAWSFTPRIVLPLFAGGANLANLQGARASRDVAVAQYEKAVQTAFREVSDALATESTIRDRVEAQRRLVAAATNAQRLSQARYDAGVDSYLVLLEAQRTLYVTRRTQIVADLVQAVNRVVLYEALGGGAQ